MVARPRFGPAEAGATPKQLASRLITRGRGCHRVSFDERHSDRSKCTATHGVAAALLGGFAVSIKLSWPAADRRAICGPSLH